MHCENNNILNEAQHGLRSKHSIISNLVEILNDITKQIDFKNNVDFLTLDFSKLLLLFHSINFLLNYSNMV